MPGMNEAVAYFGGKHSSYRNGNSIPNGVGFFIMTTSNS